MEINSNPVGNEIELFIRIPLNKISDFFQPWRKESLNNNGHSASSPFHPLTLPPVVRSTFMASVKNPTDLTFIVENFTQVTRYAWP